MDPLGQLERSTSTHSTTSLRSHRSATVRQGRQISRARLTSRQPSSSASSIAPSDKSLTSFPSFSPESPGASRFQGSTPALSVYSTFKDHSTDSFDARNDQEGAREQEEEERVKTATQENRGARSESIVDSLTGGLSSTSRRRDLFEEEPVTRVPGALHRADDGLIERLIARQGAVSLVRQIAEDLAQRDAQITALRRRADDREKALRRIIRECGLSNLELETRLRVMEDNARHDDTPRSRVDSGLSSMMSDAMHDTMTTDAHRETRLAGGDSTIRASNDRKDSRGTAKGWKDFLWGTNTAKKSRGNSSSILPSEGSQTVGGIRSSSSLDRRPGLADDLFTPPTAHATSSTTSRPSSTHSANLPDRKASGSLASLALRLVAGGAISGREAETRGRAVSADTREASTRPVAATARPSPSHRSSSVAGGPKALMAMRRSTPVPSAQPQATTKTPAQEMWETMVNSPPDAARQESYGPVEMDAILPPESQPPALATLYNLYGSKDVPTDRFGFIYDQRRKKRQREAARHTRADSRTEMLLSGRNGISPNMLDEGLPSPKGSVSSEGAPASPVSAEDKDKDKATEARSKRWQDYLKIATFPTELLSHTPSVGAPNLEVLEAPETPNESQADTTRSPSITPTDHGLLPSANTTVAVSSQVTLPPPPETSDAGQDELKEDREPVRHLLQQLNDLHDATQQKKTPLWNDFLRKVRAERRREGAAAVAAAQAAAEARYERPAVILPETRVADGEMIGISDLGNKGKIGRNKWNEFKGLVLGGIPVAYRPKIWSECSGATALRIPGYYEDLVAQDRSGDDPTVVSQIGMDIYRTLTDNIFFRVGPGVPKLKEVLVAYARRNKHVGYCQGMNLITANLLLVMPSAEDAFWVLATIVENILPPGYYDQSLASSRADQQVLRQYVGVVLPRLSAHLDSLGVELETMTFQWFLSVFTDCLCAEALFRVWDVVLCTQDGSTFLFQVALALLKLNEGNLVQCQTAAAAYTYIGHHMTEHAISIDGLLQASEGLRRVVKREDIEAKRRAVLDAERESLAERSELSVQAPRPMEG
ncbi:TBC domain-containing protein-like protein [Emericellopsis cladophorae]|uniref:TBC domain-containing protein-like protein n=1 Tax=Emericellopsis cladophorae TaxID=2686198 RepID=A0A9P9Y103_9HYPO|nr:TBC domain-containing protein-like protein [Emericellopsis cladophorae]KAI6781588.1 TBC domain-containing protein-like protein [Emericellopsis cladophorae]